jgi:hypothetical protein
MDPSTGTEPGTERAPLRPAPVPGASTKAAVPVPAGVRPVTVPERAAGAVKRARAGALEAVRELWLHPDRLLYVMWHGKPESMAEHRAYMKSRAWVPPGMDGKPEKAVIGAGLFYHLIIARPLKAAAKTVDAAADRPLRLLCLAVLAVVLIVLLARYL